MAAQFRSGDRVRIQLKSCHQLAYDGLEGEVCEDLGWEVSVILDNGPRSIQTAVSQGNVPPPKTFRPEIRLFQHNELVLLNPPPPPTC